MQFYVFFINAKNSTCLGGMYTDEQEAMDRVAELKENGFDAWLSNTFSWSICIW